MNTPEKGKFSQRQQRIIYTIGARMFYDGIKEVPEERLKVFVAEINDYISKMDWILVAALKLLLFAIQFMPFILIRKFRRFTLLAPHEQDLYFERWERSKVFFLALMFAALKVFFCLIYYEHDDVLQEIGYDGHCLIE